MDTGLIIIFIISLIAFVVGFYSTLYHYKTTYSVALLIGGIIGIGYIGLNDLKNSQK